MGTSFHECDDAELQHMETMRDRDAFLNDLKIVATMIVVDRDELILCRQDAHIVTHVDSIARHAERVAARWLIRFYFKRELPKRPLL
jgi:hypothetical protein